MKKPKIRGRAPWLYALLIIVLLAAYGTWALKRPLPRLKPVHSQIQLQTAAASPLLAWPTVGQSAVGIVGDSVLDTHNPQTPVPTASTAKLITALTVLRDKPLAPGQQGPTITLGPADVAIYNSYVARNGSVVKVIAGEQITEYQMLEAMMLPSANNMADSLAIWAFGSLNAYTTTANDYLTELGLDQTHVGVDASGFDPSTTSTAYDLVRLGEMAMQNPVLAQIVSQSTANGIPVTGSIKNINFLLGTDGIIGVKTGNTNQAGGVFIGAARIIVDGQPVTIVTALAAAPGLVPALQDSLPLIRSAEANFQPVSIIKAGANVGSYNLPWGGNVSAIAAQDLNLTVWNGSTVSSTVQLQSIAPNSVEGQPAGNVTASQSLTNAKQSVGIKLQNSPTKPSTWWRLLHPFFDSMIMVGDEGFEPPTLSV